MEGVWTSREAFGILGFQGLGYTEKLTFFGKNSKRATYQWQNPILLLCQNYIYTPSLTPMHDFNKDRCATSKVIFCCDIVKCGLELVTVNLRDSRAIINGILTCEISNRLVVGLMNHTGLLPMWMQASLIIESKNGRQHWCSIDEVEFTVDCLRQSLNLWIWVWKWWVYQQHNWHCSTWAGWEWV